MNQSVGLGLTADGDNSVLEVDDADVAPVWAGLICGKVRDMVTVAPPCESFEEWSAAFFGWDDDGLGAAAEAAVDEDEEEEEVLDDAGLAMGLLAPCELSEALPWYK